MKFTLKISCVKDGTVNFDKELTLKYPTLALLKEAARDGLAKMTEECKKCIHELS